jgi:hypothetical protein
MVKITKEIEEQVMKILKQKLAPLVFETHKTIILETPVDTSNLRRSINVEETEYGFNIGTNVEYASDVEYDTKPHIIEPKNKKALRWEVGRKARLAKGISPKYAKYAFAKRVKHPGTTGHHMFLKGINFFKQNLRRYLTK